MCEELQRARNLVHVANGKKDLALQLAEEMMEIDLRVFDDVDPLLISIPKKAGGGRLRSFIVDA